MPARSKIDIKIDQAYELAGCARQDGDKADERRWLAEAERLKQERDAPGTVTRPCCDSTDNARHSPGCPRARRLTEADIHRWDLESVRAQFAAVLTPEQISIVFIAHNRHHQTGTSARFEAKVCNEVFFGEEPQS